MSTRTRLAPALAGLLLAAGPLRAEIFTQCPPGPGVVCKHLAAGDGFIRMADGKQLYMFGFSDVSGVPNANVMTAGTLAANFPGPTIEVKEGDKLYLTLSNVGMAMRPDLFDPHTVHWHGFPNAAPIFDGMPDGSVAINQGASLTYFYNVVDPGTYMYHCHMEATEHMQMGMLANLYVHPAQDGTAFVHSGRTFTKFAYNDGDGSTGFDVEVPIQIGSMDGAFHDASNTIQPLPFALMKDNYPMLNGRGYPDTVSTAPPTPPADNGGQISQPIDSRIVATAGQRILLRISNLNVTRFNTLASYGLPMRVVGADARLLRGPSGQDTSYLTTSVTIGGGQSVDVIVDTLGVTPGTYPLYTTNLNFLSNDTQDLGGMMTEIVVQ
jgi:FtsP/CotA-like multicopper oxidase with cupredoxin domain